MNNLFNYSRSLPAPFDTLTNKKVKVSSKYGDGTEATLTATMIKAIHAVCRCMNGTGEGAVGVIDHRTVAEYKSAAGPDTYHLVVYDSSSGGLMASIYDKSTELGESYTLLPAKQDGAAEMCIRDRRDDVDYQNSLRGLVGRMVYEARHSRQRYRPRLCRTSRCQE